MSCVVGAAEAEHAGPDRRAAGTPGVIVPRKTINEVRRLFDDAGETVDCRSQKVRLEFNGAALTSKVIDGNFPDYGR